MFVAADGSYRKSQVAWRGNTETWPGSGLSSFRPLLSYAELYRTELWVAICTNKLAGAASRLPLKTYQRNTDGRKSAEDSAYAQLLRRPNRRMSTSDFVSWCFYSWYLYGEAMAVKVRDRGGRPVALYPINANNFSVEMVDGRAVYTVYGTRGELNGIDEEDVFHWHRYNPDDMLRGLSVLEPLRATLESENFARRANAALWRNGARASVVLKHPGLLTEGAANRLRVQWEQMATGVERAGATVILEEGLSPEPLTINHDDAQYVESRRLNRDEIIAAFDIPPTAVGVLEHATLSNVVELMRALYRDTMAPVLSSFEETLEYQVRSCVRRNSIEPDYGDEFYAEFLLDAVLQGDPEARSASYQRGITSAYLTPNEVREKENLPPIEGGDQLFIQGAMVPLKIAGTFLGQQTPSEQGAPEAEPAPKHLLSVPELRAVMGRLSRVTALTSVTGETISGGLSQPSREVVTAALESAVIHGKTVSDFRTILKHLTEGTAQ